MSKGRLAPLELLRFHRQPDCNPFYPKTAVDTVCRKLGIISGRRRRHLKTCLEVGAGTGNLTSKMRELSRNDFELTAVESNAALRRRLHAMALGNEKLTEPISGWGKVRKGSHALRDIQTAVRLVLPAGWRRRGLRERRGRHRPRRSALSQYGTCTSPRRFPGLQPGL